MSSKSLHPPSRPDNIDSAIASIRPETYRELLRAVETGRWANGSKLTREQREHSLQAIIAWETRNLAPSQRSGHIEGRCPSADAKQAAPRRQMITSDRGNDK